MTFTLAFNDLKSEAPRQRVRCSATGRFVAWSKVPQLRAPGARRSVFVCPPVVVDNTDAPPVVVFAVEERPPVGSVLSRMRESLDLSVGVVAVAVVFTVSATVSAVAGAVGAVVAAVSSMAARVGGWLRGSKGGSM